MHRPFCFAGQPAPCPGYFDNDELPCVCGANGTVLAALSRVAVPAVPVVKEKPAEVHLLPLSA